MNTYVRGMRDALRNVGVIRSSGPGWLSGFAIGTGVGLLAGAAIAVLLTPTTGSEMRQEIGTRAKKLAANAQDAITDVTHTVRGKLGVGEVEEPHRTRNQAPLG